MKLSELIKLLQEIEKERDELTECYIIKEDSLVQIKQIKVFTNLNFIAIE